MLSGRMASNSVICYINHYLYMKRLIAGLCEDFGATSNIQLFSPFRGKDLYNLNQRVCHCAMF